MSGRKQSVILALGSLTFNMRMVRMRRKHIGLASTMLLSLSVAVAAPAPTPYADSNGFKPPASQYKGPFFKLSHDYPARVAVPDMPWRAAIRNGQINTQNAAAYTQALKDAVGKDMRVLLSDYPRWDAAKRGWYNEPWLGSMNLYDTKRQYLGRESIHGMYVGSSDLDKSLFQQSGLKKDITTYVLTYYDKVAAQTLNRIWKTKGPTDPHLTPDSTQFEEGAVIVKAAFITAGPEAWPVMQGAQKWPLYINVDATANGNDTPTRLPKLTDAYLMQFDIIVKDSKSAPDTGWVFMTLVYDKDAKRGPNGIWDQMVVLGAQWGNDPQANSTVNPAAPLLQDWNNPKAPLYGGETFGWGQRLSGPNDGAMNNIAYTEEGQLKKVVNAKNSSCMSCHSTAQWNTASRNMPSFLLPDLSNKPDVTADGYLVSPPPGSPEWLRWFQNRRGNVPMDPGSIAGDFDMVLTFKSLPLMESAKSRQPHPLMGLDLRGKPAAASNGK